MRGNVWEESEELSRLPRVGDEENYIILVRVSVPPQVLLEDGSGRTFRISPRSPCRASAACMKLHAIPKLFIVATIFRPTNPLLPTPHIMSFPPVSTARDMASTLRNSPSCATESDS
jgi:hypothetical protein